MNNFATEIKVKSVKDLIPYARNSRTHDDSQVAQICGSIKEFGFTNPILVDNDNSIIAGHGRLLAAQKLGLKEVPTINLGYLNEHQKKAYVIADNKLAMNAGWDVDLLKLEIDELNDIEFDVELLGFTNDELKNILADKNEGLVDEDHVPELQDEHITKKGDVWLLGKHRLMCGDATIITDVEKLMNDQLADMVFTDPPYNVNYSGGRKEGHDVKFKRGGGIKSHGAILNDHMSPDEFDEFISDTFINYSSFMKPLSPIYVCHPDSQSEAKITFEKEFAKVFKKSATIIWDKGHAGLGFADYRASHEPILYGWKEGDGSHYWCGDKTKKTVWAFSKGNTSAYVHPTQKPVELIEEAIKNSCKGSDIVLDFFGGSGSTMIGAEKTGRINYSMELAPKYCDVICRRYKEYTGNVAVLSETDETFDELNHGTDTEEK